MKYLIILTLILCPVLFCQAGELLQDEAKTYREQGYKLQMAGNMAGALQYYEKAVEMDPQYAEVYNDLGVLYENMGDIDQAIQMYKKTLELDADHLAAYTNLALIYEAQGDILNASDYWKKRYDLGEAGEYWWEVARQHLLKLGTYPQLRKERLERQAATLSQKLVYEREQKRLKTIEEAQLHFDIGSRFLKEGDYAAASRELQTVMHLAPADTELMLKAGEFYTKAVKAANKEMAELAAREALRHIKKEDFLSAGEKLKESLSAVLLISHEK